MPSLDELVQLAAPIRAGAVAAYDVTAHPDEVLQIPSRDEGRFIRVHAYYSKVNRDTPAPVLLNFHGSGFVNPLHGSDDKFCRYIADKTGYTVLDCSYRLSPEHQFPAPVHDAEDAVRWVLSQPTRFDSSQVSISGFSAGGTLSLVLSSVIFPQGTFKNVMVSYPPTDWVTPHTEKTAPDASNNVTPGDLLDTFVQCYYPNPKEDVKGALASPLYIAPEKFSDRTFVATAACDILCLEGEQLANNIKRHTSKHVELHRYDGCEHAFNLAYKPGSVQEKATHDLYAKLASFLLA